MRSQDEEPELDPFLCHCGPCQTYWKRNYSVASDKKLKSAPQNRVKDTSLMYNIVQKKEDHPAIIKIGDRVVVKGKLQGVVKYIGILDENLIAPHCYVGVHLDDQVNSEHNGVFKGKRYFHCPRGHGAFVKYCDVVRINPPEKRPPVTGNPMYPNYKDMLERRKKRMENEPSMASWGPPFSKRRVVITVFDKNDIAAKDQARAQKYSKPDKTETDQPNREDVMKWKQKFGGDDRAEAMANTLRRLHIAHNKGKALECEETPASSVAFDRRHRQSIFSHKRLTTVR